MSQVAPPFALPVAESRRVEAIFSAAERRNHERQDRLFAGLLAFEWLAALAAVAWLSPLTWAGRTSALHPHVWMAAGFGGAVVALPILLALTRPAATSTRHAIGVAQMLMSALLIHLTGGRIETHFHVFGSLAFLAFYRDWRVLITASAVVAADHFLRGLYWPESVYGVAFAQEWRWLEHAGWVVFEDIFLVVSCVQGVREMRSAAERQARIEAAHGLVEAEVARRTGELVCSQDALRREIDERRGAEVALDAQRRFLRQIIDANPQLVFVKDWDGRFLLANAAVAEAYGTTPDGLVGKRDADFNARSEEVERFLADDRAVMRSLKPRHISEEPVTHPKTGATRWFQTMKVPLVAADGTARQVLGVSTEITQRKQLEAQLLQAQKMEAVGRLAGGVAHDFNNLLTAIMGYCDFLAEDLGSEHPRHPDVLEIRKAGERAAGLTRQLLAFSRKQVMQPKVLDLGAVVAGVEKMVRRLVPESIAVVIGTPRELGRVKADPGQVEQVIMNLCVNARDAMVDAGTLTLEASNVEIDEASARAHGSAQPGRYVALAVSDTGTGMSAETRAHLFEPFFTTKEPGKGTGLGLATVYGIVKQSGGHVWVYSELGLGSTFKVLLPRIDAPAAVDAAAAPAVEGRPGSETILLVEDDASVRTIAKQTLERLGYRVLVAREGGEGVALAARHEGRIDLLLTDVVMPGLSGRAVADRLAPARPEMRVLFMSGYTEDAIVHHGVLDEGIAFIEKPFTPKHLGRVVRARLDGEPLESTRAR